LPVSLFCILAIVPTALLKFKTTSWVDVVVAGAVVLALLAVLWLLFPVVVFCAKTLLSILLRGVIKIKPLINTTEMPITAIGLRYILDLLRN
jgi:hypothetical protein